jgi:hypothetical protein
MDKYYDEKVHDLSMSNTQSKTTFEIFYQNVRGLTTKQTELFDNVCSMDFLIICLSEAWLNDMCFNSKQLPDSFITFCFDRVSSTKSGGGSVVIVISSRVCTCKHKYDLQFYEECMSVQIST